MTTKITKTSVLAAERAKRAKQKAFQVSMAKLRKATLERQDQLLAECQTALRAPGVNFAAVGRDCGLSGMTVAKFAYGPHNGGTVRPAMTTVIAIFESLGYELDKSGPSGQLLLRRPDFDRRVAHARQKGATIHRLIPRAKVRR